LEPAKNEKNAGTGRARELCGSKSYCVRIKKRGKRRAGREQERSEHANSERSLSGENVKGA
jgi:hypothetical protein